MISFNFSYDVLTIDSDAYKVAVNKYIMSRMYEAARAFVRAAIPKIPVDTGMARGTFLNIGRLLGITIPIPIQSVGKLYNNGGILIPKQPESGAALAIPASQALRFENNRFIFEFDQNVFHYNLNEFYGGHAPTAPWQSYAAGEEAFNRVFAQDFLKNFPKIADFTTKQTVSI